MGCRASLLIASSYHRRIMTYILCEWACIRSTFLSHCPASGRDERDIKIAWATGVQPNVTSRWVTRTFSCLYSELINRHCLSGLEKL